MNAKKRYTALEPSNFRDCVVIDGPSRDLLIDALASYINDGGYAMAKIKPVFAFTNSFPALTFQHTCAVYGVVFYGSSGANCTVYLVDSVGHSFQIRYNTFHRSGDILCG